jgi:hypothetical protein
LGCISQHAVRPFDLMLHKMSHKKYETAQLNNFLISKYIQ